MIHSLQSIDFLKISEGNCVLFEFTGDKKEITIQQQYVKENRQTKDDQTKFDIIYKIKISDSTLRNLLFLHSITLCNNLADILGLVEEQPNSSIFYQCFLELDVANMASILSFDSRSMKVLLDDTKNKPYFQEQFPIFFKNKIVKTNNPNKYFYRSAIDNALANNQIIAIEYMIQYIVKYQNNYTSSFLFRKNFCRLMEKGI